MTWYRLSKPTIVLGRPTPSWPPAFRSSTSTSKVLSLLIFIILYLTALLYCRTHFFRDPTSHFFDPVRGYGKIYSNVRQTQADVLIYSSSNTSIHASSSPTLCVGVITVARPREQYVRGTIGSLLEGLSDDQRRDVHLILFIAHTDPHAHPIFRETWVASLPDALLGYGEVDEDQLTQLREWEEAGENKAKGLFDYLYLLEHCHRTGSPYIAMVEDDVLAVDGWFPRAMAAAEEIVRHGDDWLYLRMFFSEIFLGWNREEWPTYLGWSSLAFLSLTGTLIAARAFSPRLRKELANPTLAAVTLVCLPLCIALYFLAGRVSMQPPRTGLHRMDDFGCCSQGLLYPRAVVPVLQRRLAHGGAGYVDTLVEDAARQERLARWVLVPSLLQHVGAHSSKVARDADEKARVIWNFAFETVYGSYSSFAVDGPSAAAPGH